MQYRKGSDLTNWVIARNGRDTGLEYLRDPDNPLRVRYLTDRGRASWDSYYKGVWRPFGRWPALDYHQALSRLPAALELRQNGGKTVRAMGALLTVGQLLDWYQDRQLQRRELSPAQKKNIQSAVKSWLKPRLGDCLLSDLDKALMSRKLIEPMSIAKMSGYIRKVHGTLMAAIRAALHLGLVLVNPLHGIAFKDYGLPAPKPKVARLREGQLLAMADLFFDLLKTDPPRGMLTVLMLCHGTRLKETRQLRWEYLKFAERLLVIPAELTKTRVQLELPLTGPVLFLLKWYAAYCQCKAGKGESSAFLFDDLAHETRGADVASRFFRQLSGGAWSSHDIRKLMRGALQLLDVNHLVAESLLNHAPDTLAATYVQVRLEAKKRSALELYHGCGTEDQQGLNLAERVQVLASNVS